MNFSIRLPVVGHFTRWVQDEVELFGYAAILSKIKNSKREEVEGFISTCIYSYGNMLGAAIWH